MRLKAIQLTDLGPSDLALLTRILFLRPDRREDPIHYSNRVKALIEALPSRLKADNLFKRLIRHSLLVQKPDDLEPLNQRGSLCLLHEGVNATIVKQVFTLVALEVGVHLNRLASRQDLLNEDQKLLIARLRSLHAIWYEPQDYERLFQQSVTETAWNYQQNKCAACSLSRIAGDQTAILDLTCIIESRTHSSSTSKARLAYWLEAWLSLHSEEGWLKQVDFHLLLSQKDARARDLRRVRKLLARKSEDSNSTSRRASTNGMEPAKAAENQDSVGVYEHLDDERLLSVNAHTALLSSPHLPDMSQFTQVQTQHTQKSSHHTTQEYVPPRVTWNKQDAKPPMPERSARRPTYVDEATAQRGGHRQQANRNESKVPRKGDGKPHEPTDQKEIREMPKYRSLDVAAESYANVLPRPNPFTSHVQPTASQWTDCSVPPTRRSSIDSFISKYANYGGLPLPPDGVHVPGHENKRPDDKKHQDKPLLQRADAASRHADKDKSRARLSPEDIVRRAKSTSATQYRSGDRKDAEKREKSRPPPINVDTRKTAGLPAVDVVTRATTTSDRTRDRSQRETLPSSTLLGRESNTHQTKKATAATVSTHWSYGDWHERVKNMPENKFYRDRIEGGEK